MTTKAPRLLHSIFLFLLCSTTPSCNAKATIPAVGPVEDSWKVEQNASGLKLTLKKGNVSEKTTTTALRVPKNWRPNFHNWLCSIDGGRKSGSTADGYVQIIGKLSRKLKLVEATDLLYNRVAMREYLTDEIKQPGTALKYIYVLNAFFTFMRIELGASKPIVDFLRDTLSAWLRSFRTSAKVRQREKIIEDSKILISVDMFNRYRTSEFAKSVEDLLDKPKELEDLQFDGKRYGEVRDHLMLLILLENAQRSGIIPALTRKAIKGATIYEDGTAVVQLSSHKTGFKYVANVVFTNPLWNWTNNFMKRAVQHTDDDKSIFVYFSTQTPVLNREVVNRLKSVWKLAGLVGPINATLIRKSVTTRVYQEAPAIREQLAEHMTHLPSTAERYYRVHNGPTASIALVKRLKTIMDSDLQSAEV